MKKTLLTACSLLSFGLFAQPGQSPNNSFEDWGISEEFQTLLDWQTNTGEGEGLISRDTNATEGMYSTYLQTQDVNTVATAAFIGYIDANGNSIAYTSQVDSFYLDVQYDMMPGDTASIAIIQTVNGNPQPIVSGALLAGSQTTWGTLAIPMVSPSQDSIAIYITTENLFTGEDPITGSWLRVDNARFIHSSATPAPLDNFSFENWDIVEVIEPEFFSTSNVLLQANGFDANVEEQTTGANDGTSFARLTTLDLLFFQIPGVVTNGSIDDQFNISNGAPYVAQPDSLVGYYKGTIATDDTASISVTFFQNGSILDDTVLIITQSASAWTKYTFEFDLPTDPDSMSFLAISGFAGGSVLDIDDFTFYGGDLGLEDAAELEFTMYPNPSSDILTVKAADRINEIVIYNLAGAEVDRLKANNNFKVLSIAHLPAGTYLMEVHSGNAKSTQTLIKQ